MTARSWFEPLVGAWLTVLALTAGPAAADSTPDGWGVGPELGSFSDITFIHFQSPNLSAPTSPLTIEGKLSIPRRGFREGGGFFGAHGKMPAVLILHGSSGVDARGDFYEAALNAAGIATLQIDMWQARGIVDASQRPAAPILTYPDAFSALALLSQQRGIDASRIGVLGFSWGGLVSLGAAEQLYAGMFGGGRTFKAHVANYPICYGWNDAQLLQLLHTTPARFGTQLLHLTGAPVLIQIGTKDDYDDGSGPCRTLAQAVNSGNGSLVSVNEYPGATHAWDRLMVPIVVADPYANLGSYFMSGVVPPVHFVPDVDQAHESRARVVRFFLKHL